METKCFRKDNLFKNNLWETSTRVPLIIAHPQLSQQANIHSPAGLIDIFPTICEIAGATGDNRKTTQGLPLDGKSLLPAMRGLESKDAFALTLVEDHNDGINLAIRTEHWRYILYADMSEELYDHRIDPSERNNLALNSEYESKKASLKQKLLDAVE